MTSWSTTTTSATDGSLYAVYNSNEYYASDVKVPEFEFWFEGRGFKSRKELLDYTSSIASQLAMLEFKDIHDKYFYKNNVLIDNYQSKHRKVIDFDYHNKRRMALQKLYFN